jgi:hypothetical protein
MLICLCIMSELNVDFPNSVAIFTRNNLTNMRYYSISPKRARSMLILIPVYRERAWGRGCLQSSLWVIKYPLWSCTTLFTPWLMSINTRPNSPPLPHLTRANQQGLYAHHSNYQNHVQSFRFEQQCYNDYCYETLKEIKLVE